MSRFMMLSTHLDEGEAMSYTVQAINNSNQTQMMFKLLTLFICNCKEKEKWCGWDRFVMAKLWIKALLWGIAESCYLPGTELRPLLSVKCLRLTSQWQSTTEQTL